MGSLHIWYSIHSLLDSTKYIVFTIASIQNHMDSRICYVMFIASLLLCLSLSPAPFANARASPIVRGVCKQARDKLGRDYKQCIRALWRDTPVRLASNLKDLDIAILKLALANAGQSKAFFESMLNTTNSVKGTKAIKQCVRSHDFALGGFVFTIQGVSDGDKSSSEVLTQVQDEFVGCERALTLDRVQLPNLLSAKHFLTILFRDVALLVTSQLWNI